VGPDISEMERETKKKNVGWCSLTKCDKRDSGMLWTVLEDLRGETKRIFLITVGRLSGDCTGLWEEI
jgi:hypothetical protein